MVARIPQKLQRVVAVVVTHNRRHQLEPTLARLFESSLAELEGVIVVDNASTDGTADYLAELRDPRLVVIRPERNLGGAGGFETGIRQAITTFDPDWVVVMDDDARPSPGALAAFHAAYRPNTTAVAAAVFFPNGRICEMNRPSVNPFWSPKVFLRTLVRGRDGYHIDPADYESSKPRSIDLTSFVGLFLSRHMLKTAGLPDGRLFLYGDDVIYTLNLRRQGFSIVFDPTVRFEHDSDTFENDRRRVFQPLWKVYYAYRNGLIMYHTAAGILFWPLLLILVPKWWLAAKRYGSDRGAYMRLMRAAVSDALRGRLSRSHPEVLALAGISCSGCRDGNAGAGSVPSKGRLD